MIEYRYKTWHTEQLPDCNDRVYVLIERDTYDAAAPMILRGRFEAPLWIIDAHPEWTSLLSGGYTVIAWRYLKGRHENKIGS